MKPMKIETTTETKATFRTRQDAIEFAQDALDKNSNYRVWFSCHYWEPEGSERYEVTVASNTETANERLVRLMAAT